MNYENFKNGYPKHDVVGNNHLVVNGQGYWYDRDMSAPTAKCKVLCEEIDEGD